MYALIYKFKSLKFCREITSVQKSLIIAKRNIHAPKDMAKQQLLMSDLKSCELH